MFARRLLSDPGLPKRSPTTSYWQQHYEESLPDIQSKSLATHRDIVIIGSGITGCSTALTLLETEANSENPPSVTVLEARGLCSGATGRNGGHVKFNAVSEYADHKARLGHEAAVHLVRFSMSHYQAIKSAAERLGVLEIGEVREVTAITSIMDPTKVAHVKASFHDFEQTFPDLKGSYTFVEGLDETRKVSIFLGFSSSVDMFCDRYSAFQVPMQRF